MPLRTSDHTAVTREGCPDDAGGLRALLERIRDLLHPDELTVTGKTLGENIAGAEVFDEAQSWRERMPKLRND